MKNNIIITGTAHNIRENTYNGRDFLSMTVRVPDPDRCREDGTPFTHSISVNVTGPMATHKKGKLKDNMCICVEGRFEPYKDKNDVMRFPVNAAVIDLMDAGVMNHAVIQGRLTRDPELRRTGSGKAVCTATFAVDRSYKDKSDNWQDVTSFVTVVAWEDEANKLANFRKGNMVWITGKITSRKWTDKDNQDRYVTEIVATSVLSGGSGKFNQMADGTAPASASSNHSDAAPVPDNDGDFAALDCEDEELPF